jgi:3-oxoacyl-[acyl-carrier-protein] synthase-1
MIQRWTVITPDRVVLQGEELSVSATGHALLVELYRKFVKDYPKFFKMDALCQLGFLASELLLKEERPSVEEGSDSRAMIFFNQSSSLNADTHFQATIQSPDNYYPSPSVFVYTLPNIVTGEIAIRNKYYGETSFFVLPEFDAAQMAISLQAVFQDPTVHSVLGGWLNCNDENHFEALVFLLERSDETTAALEEEINSMHKPFNF